MKNIGRSFLNTLKLALIVAFTATSAMAEDEFIYRVNADNSATIVKYRGPSGAVTIPEDIVGFPVSTIEDWAFNNSVGVTSISVPASMTSIADFAFYNAGILTSISVNPANPTYSSVDGVLLSKDKSTLIQFPSGRAGNYSVPTGVTTILENAFYFCLKLNQVSIPASVVNINELAFYKNRNLASINVNEASLSFSSDNGVLLNKDQTRLIQFPPAKPGSYTVPSDVTSFGEYAFYQCLGLTSIVLPNGLTEIPADLFEGCRGLSSVTIPETVTSIGPGAFLLCISLPSVTISDNITSIGEYAFYSTALTEITIPDSVTSIGKNAFYRCEQLTSISLSQNITAINEGVFSRCLSLTQIALPSKVTAIEASAFSGCNLLTDINIPDGVTKIGETAFSGCKGLTSLTIPASVTQIGNKAFAFCDSLRSIYFEGNAPQMGTSIVAGASNLVVYYAAGSTGWDTTFEGWPTVAWNINIGPEINFEIPSEDITLEEGENLYVKVNATDLDGIKRVRLYIDGVELARSEGGAPYEWGAENQNDPELQNLQAGTFVLTAKAWDNLDEYSETSITVTVESLTSNNPVVTFIEPASDNVTLNVGETLYVNVGATDDDGIKRVYLYKNDVALAASEGLAPYEWNAQGQRQDLELMNLQAGTFVLKAAAKDNAGNWGEKSINVTVRIPEKTTTVWTASSTNLWTDADNWSGGESPISQMQNMKVVFNVQGAAESVLDTSATIGQLVMGDNGTTNGNFLRIVAGGDLLSGLQPDGSALWTAIGYNRTSTLTVEADAVFETAANLLIGFKGTGDSTLIVDGGTVYVGSKLLLGAIENTNRGLVEIGYNGVLSASELVFNNPNSVINLTGGTLVLDGDQQAAVNTYFANGNLTAFNGDGTLNVGYDAATDTTVVSAAYQVEDLLYTIHSDDTITITGYTGAGGTLDIPSIIEGLPVTDIGPEAFYFDTSLISVTVPSSVTNIGEFAFYNNDNLESVYFKGNAPVLAGSATFSNSSNTVVYYVAGTANWSATFGGKPTAQWNPPVENNLVQNHSFEIGGSASSSWTLSGGMVGSIDTAQDGNWALKASGRNQYATQTISTLVTGSTYRLSVRINTAALTAEKVVFDTSDQYDAPGQCQFVVKPGNGGWVEYTGSFVATNNTVQLRFFAANSYVNFAGFAYCDNLVLTEEVAAIASE